MYYPYRRYSPFNNQMRGNFRYGNYPPQNNFGYANNQMQGNFGFANNPMQGNFGFVNNQMNGNPAYVNNQAQGNFGFANNPPQTNFGYANNQMNGNLGYVNNQAQANMGYPNNPSQANVVYANNPSQANFGYTNNMMNMSGAAMPMGNAVSVAVKLTDNGPGPFVANIEEAAKQNNTFRTALWTGEHLQLTLMSINSGEDIGFEVHPDVDQFIRIEEGSGILVMGDQKENLDFQKNVSANDALIIPAGKWHNLVNSGRQPLKLYSIYAPPQHPFGTVHLTKADTKTGEKDNG